MTVPQFDLEVNLGSTSIFDYLKNLAQFKLTFSNAATLGVDADDVIYNTNIMFSGNFCFIKLNLKFNFKKNNLAEICDIYLNAQNQQEKQNCQMCYFTLLNPVCSTTPLETPIIGKNI